jgi:hypothetical protein
MAYRERRRHLRDHSVYKFGLSIHYHESQDYFYRQLPLQPCLRSANQWLPQLESPEHLPKSWTRTVEIAGKHSRDIDRRSQH